MDFRWCPSPKEMRQGPNQIPSAVVFPKNALFMAIFGIFFHWYLCRNRYTVCVQFENVMKRTHKKNTVLTALFQSQLKAQQVSYVCFQRSKIYPISLSIKYVFSRLCFLKCYIRVLQSVYRLSFFYVFLHLRDNYLFTI